MATSGPGLCGSEAVEMVRALALGQQAAAVASSAGQCNVSVSVGQQSGAEQRQAADNCQPLQLTFRKLSSNNTVTTLVTPNIIHQR